MKKTAAGLLATALVVLTGCTTAGPFVTNISSDGRGNLIIEKNTVHMNAFTGDEDGASDQAAAPGGICAIAKASPICSGVLNAAGRPAAGPADTAALPLIPRWERGT